MSGYFKPHVSIEVNSRRRTRGSIERSVFSLSHQIKFSQSPAKSYWVRMENVQMPFSFYQVADPFNVFRATETDAGGINPLTIVCTITAGNYTITELLTELESCLDTNTNYANSYTLSYDDVTNKVTFRYDGGTSLNVTIETIASGSTLNQLIGLGKADTDFITGGDSTLVLLDGVDSVAPNCVDLHRCSYIDIETSVTSANHYTEDTQKHIGVRVPILVDRNEVQFFSNHDGHMSQINSKAAMANIEFTLIDEYGNLKDLCEADWSGDLCFYELTEPAKAL